MKDKKGQFEYILWLPVVIVILVVWGVLSIAIPDIRTAMILSKIDQGCIKLEKISFCDSMGMELGSTVITPSGLFGGPPYNKEVCVSRNNERLIHMLHDLDYKKCLLPKKEEVSKNG